MKGRIRMAGEKRAIKYDSGKEKERKINIDGKRGNEMES